jgi:hypothetical protein
VRFAAFSSQTALVLLTIVAALVALLYLLFAHSLVGQLRVSWLDEAR